MKLIVCRGAHEIGGSCVEVSTDSARILLDLGMPLVSEHNPEKKFDSKILKGKSAEELLEMGILPCDIQKADALVLSHAHQDHYGLLAYLALHIPVYLGEETRRLIEITGMFIMNKENLVKNPNIMEPGKSSRIGDIEVTPYLMDHSAFGAFGLLIQNEGKSIYYSGDFRGHGRKRGAFEWFLKHGPKNVDCLLMEGTMIGRGEKLCDTEDEVEKKLVPLIRGTKNIVFGWFSGQNIDRLVSFFRAAKRNGRILVIDLYTAYLLHNLKGLRSTEHIPMPDWDEIRVFFPHRLMQRLKRLGYFEKVIPLFRKKEIGKNEISKCSSEIVMMFRDSMWKELKDIVSLKGATLIYSQYEGYLKEGRYPVLVEEIKRMGIRFETIHTSGHAYVEDLKRFCDAIKPKVIVPIHTFHGAEYQQIFKNFKVLPLRDNEMYDL